LRRSRVGVGLDARLDARDQLTLDEDVGLVVLVRADQPPPLIRTVLMSQPIAALRQDDLDASAASSRDGQGMRSCAGYTVLRKHMVKACRAIPAGSAPQRLPAA